MSNVFYREGDIPESLGLLGDVGSVYLFENYLSGETIFRHPSISKSFHMNP